MILSDYMQKRSGYTTLVVSCLIYIIGRTFWLNEICPICYQFTFMSNLGPNGTNQKSPGFQKKSRICPIWANLTQFMPKLNTPNLSTSQVFSKQSRDSARPHVSVSGLPAVSSRGGQSAVLSERSGVPWWSVCPGREPRLSGPVSGIDQWGHRAAIWRRQWQDKCKF